ncbi:hypothetical protein SSX86_027957 [Deinandra increscens subsp. villosa]|uniref:F-box domain-containing protein n=1 Tax=Deinandra increscens subsp. villosa TaxID=3103831 RepID=A0AAP0GKV3_9ASTR
MVNTIAKIKKTQTTLKTSSIQDSYNQSAALIGHNDDLLTEILLRLPAASIFPFKSVSKHWRWLLSQTSFTHRYDDKPSKSPGLFVGNAYVPFDAENRSPPPFRTLDFCYDPRGIKILQSCNGLLLCCSNTLIIDDRKYYVFNPNTKQFAVIPPVPGVTKTLPIMVLAFHRTDCVPYKVVCIRRRLDKKCQILIYSSDTRNWKWADEELGCGPAHTPYQKVSIRSFSAQWPDDLNLVYWNKAIHYLCSTTFSKYLYFKVDDERLLKSLPLRLPVSYSSFYDDPKPRTLYFGESRGHLHLVAVPHRKNYLSLNVYEMWSDYSGWLVRYRVELDEVARMYGSGFGFDVCDVVRGEKEEDTFMVLRIPGKIIKYNVHDKSFEEMFNLITNNLHGVSLEVHRYTETLASV